MMQIDEQNGCPSFEDVSAHLDGEADSAIVEHIGQCTACQRLIASLKLLDSSVSKACQPTAGLSDRIMAACMNGTAEPAPSIIPFWNRAVVRYAAAIALTATLAFAVKSMVGGSGNPVGPGGNQNEIAIVPAGHEGLRVINTGDVIDSNDIETVNVIGTQQPDVAANTGVKRVVGQAVSHVWGVSSLKVVENDFRKALPEGAFYNVLPRKDGLVFQTKLTDKQLQKMVEDMHEKGWQLFTPSLPQPGKEANVKFTGSTVTYEAEFVPTTVQ
jgi:hypothetical protein